jgi:hypothetical protein
MIVTFFLNKSFQDEHDVDYGKILQESEGKAAFGMHSPCVCVFFRSYDCFFTRGVLQHALHRRLLQQVGIQ